jgi:hypothetical protein
MAVIERALSAEPRPIFVGGRWATATETLEVRNPTDGSVAGTIQIRGTGELRYVALPAGTLRIRGEHYCATHPRLMFEPCFEVVRTSAQSFRGSLLGFASLFCSFTRHKDPPIMTRRSARLRSSQPMQLTPSVGRAR